MPRVSAAKKAEEKAAGVIAGKKAGELVGAFSAADAAGYIRRLIAEEGERLTRERLTPTQRSTVILRISGLADRLGKLTGETLVVDERKWVKTPAGQRLIEVITRALEPWPKAMLAVADALEQMGD
jgi:hypothetical protein